MRLRYRFLSLILVLLIAVVGGSFYWLHSDLREEFIDHLGQSLEASLSLFRSEEIQRYDTLEVLAGSLERSPGFRNVLRRTDSATLRDFLLELNEAMRVDLILVTDADGSVRYRSDDSADRVADNPALAGGLDGYLVRDYQAFDNVLYQGVTVPLLDSQSYVVGTLTLAYRVDRAFLTRLARRLNAEIALTTETGLQLSSTGVPEDGSSSDYVQRQGPLSTNGDISPGRIVFYRDLSPVREFVLRSRGRLVALGGSALLAALLISIPVIGRLTHPVELLAQTQARMETLLNSIPEGLVSLDPQGVIRSLNPAATVALGKPSEELLGKSLREVLPRSVHHQLMSAPPGTAQHARMERQGALYLVSRSFVRQASSDELGSFVLFRDVSELGRKDRHLNRFLEGLSHRLLKPEARFPLRLALKNLMAWSRLRTDELKPGEESIPAEELAQSCRDTDWDGERPLQVISPTDPFAFRADSGQLRLLLENLVDNAVRHGQGPITVRFSRDGGAGRIEITDEGRFPLEHGEQGLFDQGLGLQLCHHIAVSHGGRMELVNDQPGARVLVKIPL